MSSDVKKVITAHMINLSTFSFEDDPYVFTPVDQSLVHTLLWKYQTKPAFGDMRRRARGVGAYVKKHGYNIAIINCPPYLSVPLMDVFEDMELTVLFPITIGEKTYILDVIGNPIYRR